jgi:hypothetical protein
MIRHRLTRFLIRRYHNYCHYLHRDDPRNANTGCCHRTIFRPSLGAALRQLQTFTNALGTERIVAPRIGAVIFTGITSGERRVRETLRDWRHGRMMNRIDAYNMPYEINHLSLSRLRRDCDLTGSRKFGAAEETTKKCHHQSGLCLWLFRERERKYFRFRSRKYRHFNETPSEFRFSTLITKVFCVS